MFGDDPGGAQGVELSAACDGGDRGVVDACRPIDRDADGVGGTRRRCRLLSSCGSVSLSAMSCNFCAISALTSRSSLDLQFRAAPTLVSTVMVGRAVRPAHPPRSRCCWHRNLRLGGVVAVGPWSATGRSGRAGWVDHLDRLDLVDRGLLEVLALQPGAGLRPCRLRPGSTGRRRRWRSRNPAHAWRPGCSRRAGATGPKSIATPARASFSVSASIMTCSPTKRWSPIRLYSLVPTMM
jgi:hypothetical protein